MTKHLFIFDADYTLRLCTVPGQHYPRKLTEQRPIEHMRDRLRAIDWKQNHFGIATNQAGIAKGEFYVADVLQMLGVLTEDLLGQWTQLRDGSSSDSFDGGINESHVLVHVRYCPHRSALGCACKKPSPWMVLDIARVCDVSLNHVTFVGDMELDQQTAARAGVKFQWAWDFCEVSKQAWFAQHESKT